MPAVMKSIMCLCALLLAALAFRVGTAEALPPSLTAGGIIVGQHPRIMAEAADLVALSEEPSDVAKIVRLAYRAPLSEAPYVLRGSALLRRGAGSPVPDAVALLKEAKRLNPRERQARLLLLQEYTRTGEAGQASQEIIDLARITPSANLALTEGLAQLLIEDGSRSAALAALTDNPLAEGVLNQLAAMKASPSLLFELARRNPNVEARSGPWKSGIVNNLVEQGAYERARTYWRRFNSIPKSAYDDLIVDSDFDSVSGPPPFGWSLAEGEIGAAEIRQSGGLDIAYFGRQSGALASQLLLLAPGTYRFGYSTEGDIPKEEEGGNQIVWSFACADGPRDGRVLSTIPLVATRKPAGSTFEVPQNCPAQWLRLSANAQEFPRNSYLQIDNIVLNRTTPR